MAATTAEAVCVKLPEFAAAARWACVAAPKRTPKDVLKSVRITGKYGRVAVAASDGEVFAAASVEAAGGADFAAFARASRFSAVLPKDVEGEAEAEIGADGNCLRVRIGRASFDFAAGVSDEWKEAPVVEWPVVSFTVPHGEFASAVRRTIFATDIESTRYALGGIAIDLEEGRPILLATDSRRLSIAPLSAATKGSGDPLYVVPARAMDRVAEMPCGTGETLAVHLGPKAASFECGCFRVVTGYVEGRFPKWRAVIPTAFTAEIEAVAGPVREAFHAASLFTDDEWRAVDVTASVGTLRIESRAQDVGRAVAEVSVGIGEIVTPLLLDPKYIVKALDAVAADAAIHLRSTDGDSPVVIDHDGWRYLVMPVHRDDA